MPGVDGAMPDSPQNKAACTPSAALRWIKNEKTEKRAAGKKTVGAKKCETAGEWSVFGLPPKRGLKKEPKKKTCESCVMMRRRATHLAELLESQKKQTMLLLRPRHTCADETREGKRAC